MASTPAGGTATGTPTAEEIRARVASVPIWYHTFEFPHGIKTEGWFDHTKLVKKLPIPEDLTGKRCLDLASSDGYFAYEMARRGGDVVSVDLEDTTQHDQQGDLADNAAGSGARERFDIAGWALGLNVERVDLNLYDVSPETLGGEFDFVFIGNILLHLSDPGAALKAARTVTRGKLLSFETINLTLSLMRPRTPAAVLGHLDEVRWWTTNTRGHKRLAEAANFTVEDAGFPLFQPFGSGFRKATPRFRRHHTTPWGVHLAYMLWTRPVGVPSQWIVVS
jgi:tRNA (mo5U34)-methyltransferase